MGGSSARIHAPFALLIAVAIGFSVWSFVGAGDRATWFFELIFGWAGVIVLAATYRRFRFSWLAYLVCALFFVILSFGARYTYEETPIFNWLKEHFHLARNYSDRLGHFFQGVVPALLSRELLVRTTAIARGFWTVFVPLAAALAVSAFYELIEMWWVWAFYPARGPEWLGMQGDIWDAQWDMTMALLGGLFVVVLLARLHDRALMQVAQQGNSKPETRNPK